MKPLVPLGVTLILATACGAVLAHDQITADNPTHARCELRLTPVSGGTEIDGRVIAPTGTVRGTYDLAMTSRSSGGSVALRQSGDFEARPGADAVLTETRLPGQPSRQDIDLRVTVAGAVLPCAAPAL